MTSRLLFSLACLATLTPTLRADDPAPTANSLTAVPSAPATAAPATAQPKPKSMTLTLDLAPTALNAEASAKNHLMLLPAMFALVDEKPAAITREPAYQAQPKYGAIQLGNGPKSVTYFSVDEPKGQPGKLYVDLNQNGDLSDDGPGTWEQTTETSGTFNYRSTLPLHASWGSPIHEDEGGTYSIMMYKRHGDARGGYVRNAARSGKIELAGKTYNFLLVENTNDAIFTIPAKLERTRRPVQLMIDLNGDGLFTGFQEKTADKTTLTRELFPLGEPVPLAGGWWMFLPNASGSNLLVAPVAAPTGDQPLASATSERSSLLAVNTPAPDFTAQTPAGKPIKLSDFKGKIVILDFWATWCGPCKASMPGLQKIYDDVRDQGVVVLSLNVWDEKDPFDAWIIDNKKPGGTNYNFTFAFDPAGHNKPNIAESQFHVSGIPTMYIINREGKVAAALMGSGNEKNILKALTDQGIKTKPQ